MNAAEHINQTETRSDPPEHRIQSWAQASTKPASIVGFGFLRNYGDKTGTMKYVDYKPPKIQSSGEKWFVYYSYRDPATGKFKRWKVYEDVNRIKDPAEKREYIKDLCAAVGKALSSGFNPFNNPLVISVKNWTVLQAFVYFRDKIKQRGLREKTTQSYSSFISQFIDSSILLHNEDIRSLNRTQCEQMITNEKWSNTSFNNALTFGRLLFSFLIQNGITDKNPFKEIKSRQTTKTQNQPFDDKSFELIKQEADPDLLRFLMFMYHTGTRPNEARQLKYDHILRDRKMVMIPGGLSKGKKDGYVPVSDSFLQSFPDGTGFIFGKSRNYFTQKFTALKRKVKLQESYTLYSIKHTRAVHLARDGASPYAIMQLFRHSSLEMTMHYLRGLGINIGREAAEKGIKF